MKQLKNITYMIVLTIKQWYSRLREPYRSQAIANYITEFGHDEIEVNERSSLYSAINAFTWSHSAEGSGYWRRIGAAISRDHTDPKYVIPSPNIEDMFPKWSNSKARIEMHLRSALDISDEHIVNICSVSRSPEFDNCKLCNYFHKGMLVNNSDATIRLYIDKKSKLSNYHIYHYNGVRIIFRVVKPRGTKQSISDPLKATLNEYKKHIENENES